MTSASTRRLVMESVEKLDGWITRNGWKGFDPHDIKGEPIFLFLLQPLRSIPLKVLRRLALAPLAAFEANFPRLARRVLGVKPSINAKGMALFAKAYLQLFEATGEARYREKAIECLTWLEGNTAPGYAEPCWGYPFVWQSGVITPANTPASVVTSAVGDAFWTAYRVLGDRRYLDTCEGICRGFLSWLRRDEMPDGTLCFSYTPLDDFHVHNANLLVAEFLTRVGTETSRQDWIDLGLRGGGYALAEQNADGSLHYWGKVQDYYCPGCVDHYHSGFEIRCLYGIGRTTGRQEYLEAARRYYAFYRSRLVTTDGDLLMPKMRPSSVYPVNIHSCAEAILVASTLSGVFDGAQESLDLMTEWVVRNMQTAAGSFAYMKRRQLGRVVVNDMPYVRWGQGWMLLALSQYLIADRARSRGASAA